MVLPCFPRRDTCFFYHVGRGSKVVGASGLQSIHSGFETPFAVVSNTDKSIQYCTISLGSINKHLAVDNGGYLCTNYERSSRNNSVTKTGQTRLW